MNLRIVPIQHGSAAYREAVALRHEVLRKPLGMAFTEEQLAAERDAWHYAAYLTEGGAERMVATAFFAPLEGKRMQLRQMAIAPDLHRKGVGRALLLRMETDAAAKGVVEVIAEAREAALPFYRSLGYEVNGETFEHVGLPHRMIRKRL